MLKEIEIPGGVREIKSNAFSECAALEKIEISEGVQIIGNGVFYGCSSLKNVSIPKSVEVLGSRVFERCKVHVTVHTPRIPEGWDKECLSFTYGITIEDVSEEGKMIVELIKKDIQDLKNKHQQLINEYDSLNSKGFGLNSTLESCISVMMVSKDEDKKAYYSEKYDETLKKQKDYWDQAGKKYAEADQVTEEIEKLEYGMNNVYSDIYQSYIDKIVND